MAVRGRRATPPPPHIAYSLTQSSLLYWAPQFRFCHTFSPRSQMRLPFFAFFLKLIASLLKLSDNAKKNDAVARKIQGQS